MKIALIGYGKMGQTIEAIAKKRGHTIVSIIDLNNQDDFNSEAFKSADVAIEFTAPQVAIDNYRRAFEAGVSVVSGTTGWSEKTEEVVQMVKELDATLFWSSNFSLGVYLFNLLNKKLAKLMNPFDNYDVEMTETHHSQKMDAPSGTAITLAEGILENLNRKNNWTKDKAENSDDLPIKSFREGMVPGIHTIRYESEVDSIEITHEAKSRDGFALGAVIAAEFCKDKKGMLGMDDLFIDLV